MKKEAKQQWQKPQLETLDVSETMAHAKHIDHLDRAYPAGATSVTWS